MAKVEVYFVNKGLEDVVDLKTEFFGEESIEC